MIILSIIGGAVLAFFLWMGNKAGKSDEEHGVPPSAFYALILIIALAGFLIAAGLFH